MYIMSHSGLRYTAVFNGCRDENESGYYGTIHANPFSKDMLTLVSSFCYFHSFVALTLTEYCFESKQQFTS